jgi:hypothetical protein
MLNGFDTMQARDLSIGDQVQGGVVVGIDYGPTGMVLVEVSAYPGSTITNTVTLSPVDTVRVV